MKNTSKKNLAKQGLRWMLVLMSLLAAIMLTACASDAEPTVPQSDAVPPYSDEIVETEPETQPPVMISMPEYECTYSGEMADVIETKELSDSNALEFSVKLSTKTVPVFVLHFNTEVGDYVEFMTSADGTKVPVAFEMMTLPEGLDEDDATLFYLAQDTVNEIVASITLK